MAQEGKISTQTAIMLGSVVIALGLFLGLRGRSEAPPAPPPTQVAPPGTGQTPISGTGQTPSPPAAPPAAPEVIDTGAIKKQAEAELAKQKKTLTDTCLLPSLAKQPEPKAVKLTLDYSFDKDGKQISRGLIEDRETTRADVSSCLAEKLQAISVSPPGQTVRVSVPFALP